MKYDTQKHEPVSYTHLDVYKRQSLYVMIPQLTQKCKAYGLPCPA